MRHMLGSIRASHLSLCQTCLSHKVAEKEISLDSGDATIFVDLYFLCFSSMGS